MPGESYSIPPEEPILFISNVVSNSGDLAMVEQNPALHCSYDFSPGNYFFGSHLGWDEGELPAGMLWDPEVGDHLIRSVSQKYLQPVDLGEEGRERLQAIKCRAGPSWELSC